jgi:hypothetical protein
MDTLGISNERPVLDITTRAAKLHIRTRRPVLKIKRAQPVMRVERRAPAFKVNRLNVRAQTGIAYSSHIAEQYNDDAFRATMEALAQISHKNNVLKLDSHVKPVVTAVKTAAVSTPKRVEGGQVEWDLGSFRVEWSVQQVEMEWDVSARPEITVEQHVVEIRLRNHPAVRVRVNKDAVRNAVGVKVDKKI